MYRWAESAAPHVGAGRIASDGNPRTQENRRRMRTLARLVGLGSVAAGARSIEPENLTKPAMPDLRDVNNC